MKNFIFMLFCVYNLWTNAQTIGGNIGDIIEINGHKAIIFYLDDSGEHGTAMYVKAFRGVDSPWCIPSKLTKNMPDLSDKSNGKANTEAILSYANNNNSISSFPVFEWCRKLGEGWYVPSLEELEKFINFWLGNETILDWDSEVEVDESKPYFKEINKKLLDAGGIPFINGVYTSTVDKDGKVYVFNYNRRKNQWSLKRKNLSGLGIDCVGRAFFKF